MATIEVSRSMTITTYVSKTTEIAKKIQPHLYNEQILSQFSSRKDFRDFLKFLLETEIIDKFDYSYCSANMFRILIELKLFHLLPINTHLENPMDRMSQLWMDISHTLILLQLQTNKAVSVDTVLDELIKKLQVLKTSLNAPLHEKVQELPQSGSQVFNIIRTNFEELFDQYQKKGSSSTTILDLISPTQKLLFNLRESLSQSGIISPVLYDITRFAREIARHYTDKDSLHSDIKVKLFDWEKRLLSQMNAAQYTV